MAKKSEARIAKERKRKADKKRSRIIKNVAIAIVAALFLLLMVFAFATPPKVVG